MSAFDTLLAFINTELFPKLKELSITGSNDNRSRVVPCIIFIHEYNAHIRNHDRRKFRPHHLRARH